MEIIAHGTVNNTISAVTTDETTPFVVMLLLALLRLRILYLLNHAKGHVNVLC